MSQVSKETDTTCPHCKTPNCKRGHGTNRYWCPTCWRWWEPPKQVMSREDLIQQTVAHIRDHGPQTVRELMRALHVRSNAAINSALAVALNRGTLVRLEERNHSHLGGRGRYFVYYLSEAAA